MTELDAKLAEIGLIPLHQNYEICDSEDLNEISNSFNTPIPEDYAWFISKYGNSFISKDYGFRPRENNPWLSKGGLNEITCFYSGKRGGDSGVINIRKRYLDQIDSWFLPIAESPGGNQILLSLRPEDYGSVFFWDHEGGLDNNTYLIAESFREFLLTFEEIMASIDNERPRIVKSWISDDF